MRPRPDEPSEAGYNHSIGLPPSPPTGWTERALRNSTLHTLHHGDVWILDMGTGTVKQEHTEDLSVVRRIADVRRAVESAKRAGDSVGLVATMGDLHEGHLALVGRARKRCDTVVMSLFVNPTQFGPGEDLARYPCDEARDRKTSARAGVDLLFAPSVDELYPEGFKTTVHVSELDTGLCGRAESRGSDHFRGVATVVAKLFNIVAPDVAFFGEKDAQQARIIEQMVRDLDFPVAIEVVPTVREADGLAISSRNSYLDDSERRRARGVKASLDAAARVLRSESGGRDAAVAAAEAVLAEQELEIEYVEIVSADDLISLEEPKGEILIAVAVKIGTTRLIDNVRLHLPARRRHRTRHPKEAAQPC